jgi:hypothetical protein
VARDQVQGGVRGDSLDRLQPEAVLGAQAGLHRAQGLDRQHPRQPSQPAQHLAGARLDQADGHVLVLGLEEIDLYQMIDRVDPLQGDHQHRHRHGNAGRG